MGNNFGQELAKQTLDQIPQADATAKRIVGLVKRGGKITGYQAEKSPGISYPTIPLWKNSRQ